eukprot:CAMPEP_0114335184 /NCGR_PEP_ID=MMETSP0101-20121206/4890_1 /TAXON_ID=38822 ORGANISM="Pteridomonas danica, Strain PT" /NCGR_SAMPLE_ID=MMETSP0101 /ASSEMBLY_ACC=CAM_ASM_000211 /LENGTH=48 /DNA_ID= /DNA_START= /DNA_END= /DNA_ORIENTATION=
MIRGIYVHIVMFEQYPDVSFRNKLGIHQDKSDLDSFCMSQGKNNLSLN